MTVKISALSREYLLSKITVKVDSDEVDPTDGIVEWSFTDAADSALRPADDAWIEGDWETTGDGNHYARCLIGPSAFELPVGSYFCWIRFTDDPERPVRNAGKIQIT